MIYGTGLFDAQSFSGDDDACKLTMNKAMFDARKLYLNKLEAPLTKWFLNTILSHFTRKKSVNKSRDLHIERVYVFVIQ